MIRNVACIKAAARCTAFVSAVHFIGWSMFDSHCFLPKTNLTSDQSLPRDNLGWIYTEKQSQDRLLGARGMLVADCGLAALRCRWAKADLRY